MNITNKTVLITRANRGTLTIDLKDLQFVDGDAVKLLAMHESNRVRINNCPLYIRALIRQEKEGGGSV